MSDRARPRIPEATVARLPVYLRILGELGFLLRDETLRALLRERAPADSILGRIALLEATRTTASFRQPTQIASIDTI